MHLSPVSDGVDADPIREINANQKVHKACLLLARPLWTGVLSLL